METKELSIVPEVKTMDSREIAELTGKEHRKVCRDIEEYLGRLEGSVARFGHTYTNKQNGQEYPCYKLPFRETMILVSGYSVELRAKVVDRWLELESANKPVLPNFTNPAEAARAWANEYEARQIAEARTNRLIHNNTTYTTTEIAKELNFRSAQELNQALAAKGLQYKDRRGVWLLNSEYSNKGFVNIKQEEKNGTIIYYSQWTGLGRDWLVGLFVMDAKE